MKHQVKERQTRIEAQLGSLSHRRLELEEELNGVKQMIAQLEGAKAENALAMKDWETFEQLETVRAEDVTVPEAGMSLDDLVNQGGVTE